MALTVVEKLDKPEVARLSQQFSSDLLSSGNNPDLQQAFLNFRFSEANRHMGLGAKAEPSAYKRQLEFLNMRIAQLGLQDHAQLMLAPVVFEDPDLPRQSSYYPNSAGYRMINMKQTPVEEDSHIHEMVHAASVNKFSIKVVNGNTSFSTVITGACLTRNRERLIFSLFNEYAAISMKRDYRLHTGAYAFETPIPNYPFLTQEQKDKLLPLSRLVDAEGQKGLVGMFVGWFRRKVKKAQDFSVDFTASVRDQTWAYSDYLSIYTDVNYMLLEVGARKLGIRHKYKLSKKQEDSILSHYKDQIQIAAFTGSIRKVAIDFKDTYGKRGLHFLSDVVVNGNADQAHLYLVKLFARAGHIENRKRRNLVREKIMDFYYDSKKQA